MGADEAALQGISLSDMNAPAAIAIEIPVYRVEYQAKGAATFTQDGGEFRRQMAHCIPHEDTASEISVVSEESMKAASMVTHIKVHMAEKSERLYSAN